MLPTEGLTPREIEIARLVAQGHSNRRIADELVIAGSTAERHVANIRAKLKLRSRTEIAVWVVAHAVASVPTDPPGAEAHLASRMTLADFHTSSNLVVESSAPVGRARELRDLRQIVSRERLVTLVGPGGVGKSRLMLHAARSALPSYPDGVWVVELAALSDAAYVVSAVAATLGITQHSGMDLRLVLVEWLQAKRLLLVLDNCEHLVETCAALVQNLLDSCRELRVLVASREALRLRQEHVFPVSPLELPPVDRSAPVEALLKTASVQLFAQRARQVVPAFRVTAETARTVADICLRLDGLPLAIELAAARITVLSPVQLLVRLEHALPLLVGGARDLPTRHRTLRDTIAWSHALLTPDDQRLFRHLGVFTGGCSLETAEALNALDPGPTGSVLDGLASLIDKHLLRGPDSLFGEPRFTMLETVREFALEQVVACGDDAIVRERHARYFLSVAERGESALHQNLGDVEWLQRLEREHGNMRAALRWAEESGVVELELGLASAIAPFRMRAGHWREGFADLMSALSRDDRASPALRAQALGYTAFMACSLREWAAVDLLVGEGEPLAQQWGNRLALAMLLRSRAGLAVSHRNIREAMRLLDQAIEQLAAAEGKFAGILRLFRLQHAAWALAAGNLEWSTVLLERTLADAEASEDPLVRSGALLGLGTLDLLRGETERSAARTGEAFFVASQLGEPLIAHLCLVTLATIAGRQTRWLRLAGLLGAAEMLRLRHGSSPMVSERLRERLGTLDAITSARAALGNARFDAAWQAGSAMSPKQTVAELLAGD